MYCCNPLRCLRGKKQYPDWKPYAITPDANYKKSTNHITSILELYTWYTTARYIYVLEKKVKPYKAVK